MLERRALNWRDGKRNLGAWKIHSKIKATTPRRAPRSDSRDLPKLIRNLVGKGFALKEGPAFFQVRDHLEPRGDADAALEVV